MDSDISLLPHIAEVLLESMLTYLQYGPMTIVQGVSLKLPIAKLV